LLIEDFLQQAAGSFNDFDKGMIINVQLSTFLMFRRGESERKI